MVPPNRLTRKAHRVRRSGRALRQTLRPPQRCSVTMCPQGFAPPVPRGSWSRFVPPARSDRRSFRSARTSRDARPESLASSNPVAVRSPACQREAGHWPQRFLAASSVCAIRDGRITRTVHAVMAGARGRYYPQRERQDSSEGQCPAGRSRPPDSRTPAAAILRAVAIRRPR